MRFFNQLSKKLTKTGSRFFIPSRKSCIRSNPTQRMRSIVCRDRKGAFGKRNHSTATSVQTGICRKNSSTLSKILGNQGLSGGKRIIGGFGVICPVILRRGRLRMHAGTRALPSRLPNRFCPVILPSNSTTLTGFRWI